MRKNRRKNRLPSDYLDVLRAGQAPGRLFLLIAACFVVAFMCSLGLTTTARLVGALFLAITFAIADWYTWKSGYMKTNLGVRSRKERPRLFLATYLFLLSGEIFMLVGMIVRALRAPIF